MRAGSARPGASRVRAAAAARASAGARAGRPRTASGCPASCLRRSRARRARRPRSGSARPRAWTLMSAPRGTRVRRRRLGSGRCSRARRAAAAPRRTSSSKAAATSEMISSRSERRRGGARSPFSAEQRGQRSATRYGLAVPGREQPVSRPRRGEHGRGRGNDDHRGERTGLGASRSGAGRGDHERQGYNSRGPSRLQGGRFSMKRKAYGRDFGLTARMLLTSFLLGLLYVLFAVVLFSVFNVGLWFGSSSSAGWRSSSTSPPTSSPSAPRARRS